MSLSSSLLSLSTVGSLVSLGLFAGANVGIAFFVFPAIIALDDAHATQFFATFYPLAARVQVTQLLLAALSSLVCLGFSKDPPTHLFWAHVAVIVHSVAVVAWTLLVMLPDNNFLMRMAKKRSDVSAKESSAVRPALVNWGTRHAVRTWPAMALFVVLALAELYH